MSNIVQISLQRLKSTLSPVAAVGSIRRVLLDGFDPADDFARSNLGLKTGSALIMPAEHSGFFGIKVVTVSDETTPAATERIQGVYTLFDCSTLAPVASIDAPAMTALRTAAVSFSAALPILSTRTRAINIVAFGTGPQAREHMRFAEELLAEGSGISEAIFVGRAATSDLPNYASQTEHQDRIRAAVANADLIICATTASEPLFDSSLVKPNCVVIAVGSHTRSERELDSALMGRSNVIVEDIATAMREAGDVVQAIGEGELSEGALITLRSVVREEVAIDDQKPTVIKLVGMSWEDLAIAVAAYRASTS